MVLGMVVLSAVAVTVSAAAKPNSRAIGLRLPGLLIQGAFSNQL
jgi:hypothetical protein